MKYMDILHIQVNTMIGTRNIVVYNQGVKIYTICVCIHVVIHTQYDELACDMRVGKKK